ncbi:MAG: hypothetical protein JWR10_3478 [Rubritepida sp.]|nr:hypothetical protein [Rubritepida sp.]
MRLNLILAGTMLATTLASPLQAQNVAAPPISAPPVQVPLQDLPVTESTGERMRLWWSDIRDSLGLGSGALAMARRQTDGSRTDDFNWLMGIAGFKLKSIESTVGLLPGLSLEFGQARELSEADREYLERALERHAQRNPGMFPAIQRVIVAGIIEANEIQGFSVEKLTVTLLPLPYVKFSLAPVDAPVGHEASRILRSIERLNQRLQQLDPTARGMDFQMPPPSPLRPASATF